MYPEKNLKAENTEGWKRNISHIEGEGFFRESPIRLTYYKFFNRYVASNSGGSHHAAMVVYQSLHYNLEYKREGKIDAIDINIEKITELQNYLY
ncbi:hypothetical protein CYG68_19385 [Morganella morganii]|uniref:Uncharacterized protein n=2 Tax=Morganella morganii TaxID=582 RepID=A0A8I0PY73_MORMO|nr:hypothetical protein [Morganella morganii]